MLNRSIGVAIPKVGNRRKRNLDHLPVIPKGNLLVEQRRQVVTVGIAIA